METAPLPVSYKKPLLYAAVISVVLTALITIVVVLIGDWGAFEIRVILTTLVIAVSSVLGLACDVARVKRGSNLLPITGMALTVLGALLLLGGIWFETNSEGYWKTTASICILAIATVHLALLSLAELKREFRWVYFAAYQIIFGLAILLVILILVDFDSESMIKLVIVLAILDAAVTLIIPILHRIHRHEIAEASGTVKPEEVAESPFSDVPLSSKAELAQVEAEIASLRSRIRDLEDKRARIEAESRRLGD